MPQRADVLRAGHAAQGARSVPLRTERRGLPVPGEGGDDLRCTPISSPRRRRSSGSSPPSTTTGRGTRRAALAITRAGATVGDDRIRELAASATPVAQIVIDLEGAVVDVNTRGSGDVRDLDERHRIGRSATSTCRSGLSNCARASRRRWPNRRPMVISQVERALGDGRTQFLEVSIAPLIDSSGQAHGASVSFGDVTELGRAKAEL